MINYNSDLDERFAAILERIHELVDATELPCCCQVLPNCSPCGCASCPEPEPECLWEDGTRTTLSGLYGGQQ